MIKEIRRRYIGLSRKYASMTLGGVEALLFPDRYTVPRVLVNSIPKSGTNLLEGVLDQVPGLRRAPYRTLVGYHEFENRILRRILHLSTGQYCLSHLSAHPRLIDEINSNQIRVLNMVRDPRDMVISTMKYVTYIDVTHPAHGSFINMSSDDERLMAAIRGVRGVVAPVNEVYKKFQGWLGVKNSVSVKYEELVGVRGGSTDKLQQQIVAKILDFLDVAHDEEMVARICERAYSPTSLTYRGSQIGDWRKSFKPMHVDLFNELAGDLLVTYGYESEPRW